MVSPHALLKNNNIYYLTNFWILFYILLRLIPFSVTTYFFNKMNISIIYKLDSIYNITNIKQNHIMPFILNFQVMTYYKNIPYFIDITSLIRYYNGNIPLNFILKNNKVNNFSNVKIKYLANGKTNEKILNISNDPLYKLFEN